MAKRSRHLVVQHLENISRTALEKYQKIIREYIKDKKGVYALYRRDKLKYVGLATDLRIRLKTHLTDRHAQTWDKFSIYLTENDEHLRELEALVVRIAAPKENRQKGKFTKSENFLNRFRRDVALFQRKELDSLFCGDAKQETQQRAGRVPKRIKKKQKVMKTASLAPYTGDKFFFIKANYKGKEYQATVHKNGFIKFDGKLYSSPSSAAKQITKREMDGWHSWNFKNENGDWVLLDELRKKKSP